MKPAKSFYLKLYLFWAVWVSLTSLFFASLLSLLAAFIAYLSKGMPHLTSQTILALKEVAFLSFPVTFSLSFIVMLLMVFKKIFSQSIEGFSLRLYDCQDIPIVRPLLSDVTTLWRKWLFITVWAILIFSVLFLGFWKLLSGEFPPAHWFNGISLYTLVMVLGGIVFIFGIKNCKKVRILRE